MSDETGQPVNSLPITIDQTSGFTWPWAWYLRGRPGISYPTFSNANLQQSPDSSLVLVHSQNLSEVNDVLIGDFTEAGRVRQRWWFPESTYRGLTIGKFFSGLVDRQTWRDAMDYFLYRDGVRDRLGTEDAYLYVQRGLPLEYSAPAE